MERVGGPAILLLAVTVTLASFDWLMSLDPQWYSTIFGLYFYSGGVVGALAAVILISVGLQRSGRLAAVHVEHYHDLGKLLFAAVVFWAYMAFSQYLLIWYANIPEETQWYRLRLEGGWGIVALVLVFGHLLIPFFGLLSRHAKRNKTVLAFWAAWLLVVHWVDVYWLVMPALQSEEFPLGLVDVPVPGGRVATGGLAGPRAAQGPAAGGIAGPGKRLIESGSERIVIEAATRW
jgi:hypothetical protein